MPGTEILGIRAGNLPATTAAGLTAANNLRVASLAIALYDYICTLPAEYRFYKGSDHRISAGLVLFLLIRYVSMAVMVTSNIGFFSHNFTHEVCSHYYLTAPILKAVQTMVSQAILGLRTHSIAGRNPWVGRILIISFLATTILQWFSSLYQRFPQSIGGNCSAGSLHPDQFVSASMFNLVAVVYDVITMTISSFYLIKSRLRQNVMTDLLKVLLVDGIVYFLALTGANILNFILFRASNPSIQSAGVALYEALTWIMTQRILIHLRDAAAEHKHERAKSEGTGEDPQSGTGSTRVPATRMYALDHKGAAGPGEHELVHVEHSFVLEDGAFYQFRPQFESLHAPKNLWNSGIDA